MEPNIDEISRKKYDIAYEICTKKGKHTHEIYENAGTRQ